jgi:hypothetical protein
LLHILVVVVLFQLFKSVSKNLASLVVILGLVGVPIALLNELNRLAALVLVNGADYLKVFTTEQLQAAMMFFLDLNGQGILIAGIFWGLWLFPLGALVRKSGYVPGILGIFLIMAGFGYLTDPFLRLIVPGFADAIFPIILVLTMGEVLFMAWIVIKGARLPETKTP